jgi:hypothetical protein
MFQRGVRGERTRQKDETNQLRHDSSATAKPRWTKCVELLRFEAKGVFCKA